MKKKSYPLGKVYRLLEPGPVVLVTTAYKTKKNIMTMSWHTMIEFHPSIIACVISEKNYSFQFLKKTKECVINIPTVKLAKQVVGCGNTSGEDLDKFKEFHLTPLPASIVGAPLIKECYANLECKVIDTRMVKKYNLFFLEVQKAWVSPEKNPKTLHHMGEGYFMIPGKVLRLPSGAA